LDSRGEGVGADAIVKSNNHLTELNKMTFRKRDPELVTLFFIHEEVQISDDASEREVKEMTDNAVVTPDPDKPLLALKTTQFRIPKRKEFVEVLQKSMQRFK
jgi:predicted nucleic acid-binding protein